MSRFIVDAFLEFGARIVSKVAEVDSSGIEGVEIVCLPSWEWMELPDVPEAEGDGVLAARLCVAVVVAWPFIFNITRDSRLFVLI